MQDQSSTNEVQRTLETLGLQTLLELATFYMELHPEASEEDFLNEIFAPLSNIPGLTGKKIEEAFNETLNGDRQKSHRYAPMQISCTYCIQAMREHTKGQHESAWYHMTEARYWCGVVQASKGISIARVKTIDATRKNTASKGGIASAESRYQGIKEKVFRYARENQPINGWVSRRQSAIAIAKVLHTFERKNGEANLSPEQAPKTIDSWLKTMPDSATLFPVRKK